MANFPTSLDNTSTLPNPLGTQLPNSPSHAGLHTNENTAIIALENKLGIGNSNPTSGYLLVGNGAGSSAWSVAAPTGTVVGTTDAQVLTNKTLTSPIINAPTITNANITADSISGYTTANSGTIFGLSITSGAIASASSVNGSSLVASSVPTAALANQSVTAAKMVNGMVAQRQGGTTGTGSWYTTGTSNTNTSAVNAFAQAGSIAVAATSNQAVVFPTPYTQVPLVTATVTSATSNNAWCAVNAVTTTGFNIRVFNTSGTQVYTESATWIAIGQ